MHIKGCEYDIDIQYLSEPAITAVVFTDKQSRVSYGKIYLDSPSRASCIDDFRYHASSFSRIAVDRSAWLASQKLRAAMLLCIHEAAWPVNDTNSVHNLAWSVAQIVRMWNEFSGLLSDSAMLPVTDTVQLIPNMKGLAMLSETSLVHANLEIAADSDPKEVARNLVRIDPAFASQVCHELFNWLRDEVSTSNGWNDGTTSASASSNNNSSTTLVDRASVSDSIIGEDSYADDGEGVGSSGLDESRWSETPAVSTPAVGSPSEIANDLSSGSERATELTGHSCGTHAGHMAPTTTYTPARSVVHAERLSNALAYSMYNKLRGSRNVIFSPLGMSVVGGVLVSASSAASCEEVQNVFQLPFNPIKSAHSIKATLDATASSRDVASLDVTTGLWCHNDTNMKPFAVDDVRHFFNGYAEELDMADIATAAATINERHARGTHNRISNLVQDVDLASKDVLVTSAVAFDSEWEVAFTRVIDGNFYTCDEDGGNVTEVCRMMATTAAVPYIDLHYYRAIAIPYKTGRFSLIVVMPKVSSNDSILRRLTDVEDRMRDLSNRGHDPLTEMLQQMKPTDLAITMPVLNLSSNSDVAGLICSMGAPTVFSDAAQLWSLADSSQHKRVGSVVHAAALEFNENGGISESHVESRSSVRNYFNANLPFIFAVRDSITGNYVMMGRVVTTTIGKTGATSPSVSVA